MNRKPEESRNQLGFGGGKERWTVRAIGCLFPRASEETGMASAVLVGLPGSNGQNKTGNQLKLTLENGTFISIVSDRK